MERDPGFVLAEMIVTVALTLIIVGAALVKPVADDAGGAARSHGHAAAGSCAALVLSQSRPWQALVLRRSERRAAGQQLAR